MTPAEQTELEERIQGYIDNLADEGNPTLKAETVQQLRRLLDRVHSADGTVKRWLRAFFPNKVFKSRGTSLHKTLDGIWNEYLKQSTTYPPIEPEASSGSAPAPMYSRSDRYPRTPSGYPTFVQGYPSSSPFKFSNGPSHSSRSRSQGSFQPRFAAFRTVLDTLFSQQSKPSTGGLKSPPVAPFAFVPL